MKIIFMGTPDFAVPILEALSKKYEIALVVSQPNRAKKKGVEVLTPVAQFAKNNNLPLFQPEHIKDDNAPIMESDADMMVTAAYGQYIPSFILNKFKHAINVHGSLLPRHRGGAPIQRSLMQGDLKTGVTIMSMTKKLDAGLIYAMKEYVIKEDDNSSTVFNELSLIGRDLLLDVIDDIYNDKNLGVEQDEALATYSPNILPAEEEIHLDNNTKDIINQIKGLAMNPGAYLLVNDIKIKVYKASKVEDNSNLKPGTVINTKKCIVLKTKDAAISLDLVLMPGKKIISGKDFSNGQKIFITGEVI